MLCNVLDPITHWGQSLVSYSPCLFHHSWNNVNDRKISGMAIRHCIELGYHRSADRYRRHVDPLTKEMSKRCFWVAYDIDRVAAFILGRPVGIPDELIDAEVGFS
jgi:hypothetical protein